MKYNFNQLKTGANTFQYMFSIKYFLLLLMFFLQEMYYLRSLMLELKRLKEIQHDNVTRFVGACLDPGTNNTE